MINFKLLNNMSRGDIFKALKEIYFDYKNINNSLYFEWSKSWKAYDELIFDNPDTVGEAGFATFVNSTFSGFCSWDPRKAPDNVIVGHNGVLPGFRGKGIGVMQIKEMINRFKKAKYKNIIVSTGEEKFFTPAQKMYIKCGFLERERKIINNYLCIEYQLEIFKRNKFEN